MSKKIIYINTGELFGFLVADRIKGRIRSLHQKRIFNPKFYILI